MFFQRIRATIDEKDQKQLMMDLDVVMRCNECPYIVKFYGALFKEVLIEHLLQYLKSVLSAKPKAVVCCVVTENIPSILHSIQKCRKLHFFYCIFVNKVEYM